MITGATQFLKLNPAIKKAEPAQGSASLIPIFQHTSKDEDVVIRCAREFAAAFAKNPSQPVLKKIAQSAGCSRNSVKKYLEAAHKKGYLRLFVNLPKHPLSDELQQKFAIAEAVVSLTPTKWDDQNSIRSALAVDLIRYFESYCTRFLQINPAAKRISIGVDGGLTLYEAVQQAAMIRIPRHEYEIIPLVFGPLEGSAFTALVVANVLKSKMEASSVNVSIRSGFEVKRERSRRKGAGRLCIELLIDFADPRLSLELDILLVGIGSRRAGLFQRELALLPEGRNNFKSYFGDVCNLGFDRYGREIPSISRNRPVLVDLATLKELSRSTKTLVVGAAGGKDKLESIRIALESQYISVLITDYNTADALLRG